VQPSVGADGSAVSSAEVVVYRFLRCGINLRVYTQRSEPVSIRNRCTVDLSVMKRRPVAVVQTFAAADVCCVSFSGGCRCRAGNSFAPGFRSVGGTSRLLKYHVWWATCCRGGDFWGSKGGSLRLELGSLEQMDGPGAGTAVCGEGAVPLSAESCHPAREFLDAPQKLVPNCRRDSVTATLVVRAAPCYIA
jgi:hypothetical protein